MQLYEKGLFQLDDPLHNFLPKFADMTVNVSDSDPTDTEPAKQHITIRHLLTHTSGLIYGIFGDTPLDRVYKDAGVIASPSGRLSLEKFTDAIAELPLRYHPGSKFEYSAATEVTGRLIEVLSGVSFDAYLKENIFDPLGMVDTGFAISAEQVERLASIYEVSEGGDLQPCEAFCGFPTKAAIGDLPNFLSGGGGLYSTMSDFMKFSLMLGGKGAFEGVRLLGPRTVALMTKNHLPGGVDLASLGVSMPDFHHTRGLGFGLGVAVVLGQEFGWHCSLGTYFWQGLGSTYHLHDPVEDLTVVAMASFIPAFGPGVFSVRAALSSLSAQALVD
eukprot:CAMPEP_0203900858 /NCGR_PEP_ID=MMETSP0359-20131031/43079_1 /ASSEMBLY_ACC=CAM_ASM_000338 /TAXON_ID=268821 /ORGANISM="Scrippsiella Hangoei, Strain SHTV-5" /LENGTH=330 /DNA_ID=CAMNT_0050824401 /DNA_START=102 /DNA_END=1094 /DNA_ORIENTATION=+